ncbi:MAG: tolB protein precursor protein [Gemmatimonadota bacterium]
MRFSQTTRAAALLLLALAGWRGAGHTRRAAAAGDTLSLRERRGIAGTLAFVSERDGDAEVYVVRPSGEGLRRLTRGPEADYPAAPAPDGSGVLVVSVAEDSALHLEQLALYPLDGGAPRLIGPRMGRSRSPSWSPDGRWLVFESDEASFRDLYRIGADGTSPRRLTDDKLGNFEPAVSPDGASIAFSSSRDGDAELYVMRADGSEQRRLTAFHRDDWGALWSPDGGTLTFLSNREGADRIYLVRPDGSDIRRLTAAADTGAARGDVQESAPAWSPDGGRVAFVRSTRAGESRIRVVEPATGRVRELSDGRGRDGSPAWSPDGRYLVFTSDRDGDPELYLMRADGTGVTRLTRAPGADWLPRWLPK